VTAFKRREKKAKLDSFQSMQGKVPKHSHKLGRRKNEKNTKNKYAIRMQNFKDQAEKARKRGVVGAKIRHKQRITTRN